MKGACHCGEVAIELSTTPEYVNFCDCSFCAKNGGAWAYFSAAEVTITGATVTFMRRDIADPMVVMHSCQTCFNTTHWTLREGVAADRMGVNIRMFDPIDCAGIEARFLDGRNWQGDSEPKLRKPNEQICAANFN